MSGLKRNISSKIDQLLKIFPIVIITGVRQGGKTTLSRQIRPEWKYFDLEKGSDYDRVTTDFDFFFRENPSNIIIDEAQNSTQLFNELRGVVDSDRSKKNRFILTGSSSFELLKHVSESLTGRVAIVELGTLKANEFYKVPLSDFYTIFSSKISPDTLNKLVSMKPLLKSEKIKDFHLRGGYPEPVLSENSNFYSIWMEQYFQTYINRDIRKLFPKLNLINYRRFISMLSELSGTQVNKAELARSIDTSEVTIREYLEIAHYSFIWRNIYSYEKSQSKSLVKMPKGIYRDPGLSHFIKNIKTIEDLERYPRIGLDFEAFIIEEIIKGIEATMTTNRIYSYYRTKNGAEIDLILEGDFGTLPIEIKYSSSTSLKKLTSLNKFLKDNNLPLGIVINNSESVEKISDRIVQIPVGMI